MACYICENLEAGDTLYASSDWDGGLGFDYIRDIQYCPVCGRKLAEQTEPNCSEKPNNCEPQTYVINPQEPTNDDKCFECDDFFTCGGQCNKIKDEPTGYNLTPVETEPQTERSE